jgi:hypothetical protein
MLKQGLSIANTVFKKNDYDLPDHSLIPCSRVVFEKLNYSRNAPWLTGAERSFTRSQ